MLALIRDPRRLQVEAKPLTESSASEVQQHHDHEVIDEKVIKTEKLNE